MSKLRDVAHNLYAGQVSYDFVGKTKMWYAISGVILALTLGSLIFRGLNLGIEFKGGAEFQVPSSSCSIEQARTTVDEVTGAESIVTQLGDGSLRIQTATVTNDQGLAITKELGQECGVPPNNIDIQVVGPTWGSEVSKKALQGLVVFLILVSIFMAIYF